MSVQLPNKQRACSLELMQTNILHKIRFSIYSSFLQPPISLSCHTAQLWNMTSSQISRRLKPPQKVREELQQYLDDDEEDLLKVYATLIGFVQDVNHPTRKQLTWGNGPGQHRDIAIKEFLGFVKDILIPNFLTDEMKKRNPKLSLHKDISNVDM